MHPTPTLTDQAVADWWDALEVWQRARWLHKGNFKNITDAQFAWCHLNPKSQNDIWILRQRETHTAKETHDTQLG